MKVVPLKKGLFIFLTVDFYIICLLTTLAARFCFLPEPFHCNIFSSLVPVTPKEKVKPAPTEKGNYRNENTFTLISFLILTVCFFFFFLTICSLDASISG